MRLPPVLAVAACFAVIAACAGNGAELAELRTEVEERRASEAQIEDRVGALEEALDEALDSTRQQLAETADRAQVDALASGLDELGGAIDAVVDQLDTTAAAVEDLAGDVEAGRSDRTELDARLDAVASELGSSIGAVRGAVGELEAETAGLSDQLVALRDRVDVIQSQVQRMAR